MQQYWLLKSEPETFSIDHLIKKTGQTEGWDGVRNYQARNFMRDGMKKGDLAFFYHSNCEVPGIVGVVEIVKEAYSDPTAFDLDSPYYDSKSTPGKPRWYQVDVKFKQKFTQILPLSELRNYPELADMPLVQKGSRLSVMPVKKAEWEFICSLSEKT